jgi:hypothetical protein
MPRRQSAEIIKEVLKDHSRVPARPSATALRGARKVGSSSRKRRADWDPENKGEAPWREN